MFSDLMPKDLVLLYVVSVDPMSRDLMPRDLMRPQASSNKALLPSGPDECLVEELFLNKSINNLYLISYLFDRLCT